MTLGHSFKSELNHVFLSLSQARWNGHFQSNVSSLIYCPMKWKHPAPKGWLAFQKRQAFLSLRGTKQSLKPQLEPADWAGGKPWLPRRRSSFLDVVISPAVNETNKFWSDACAPEKGADCAVPTVWSLLATARHIKQGERKGVMAGGNSKFYVLNWVYCTLKNRQKEGSAFLWTVCADRWNHSRWHIWLKYLEKHMNFFPSSASNLSFSTNCVTSCQLASCFRKL